MDKQSKVVPNLPKKMVIALLIGVVFGIIWLAAIRFVTFELPQKDYVHYHAGVAVFINGQRQTFDDPSFYEEVNACTTGSGNPRDRVHFHQPNNDAIHVHETGVTYGHLFANINWSLDKDFIKTDKGLFVSGETNKLRFILNGKEISRVDNKVIESEDNLLVSYGDESTDELLEQFSSIDPDKAGYLNTQYDPGACSGQEKIVIKPTFSQRLKAAFGLNPY